MDKPEAIATMAEMIVDRLIERFNEAGEPLPTATSDRLRDVELANQLAAKLRPVPPQPGALDNLVEELANQLFERLAIRQLLFKTLCRRRHRVALAVITGSTRKWSASSPMQAARR